MSESKGETNGQCRREMAAAFKGTGFTANKEDWILAHGIDRLAAELDDVKEMVREIALQAPSEFGRDASDVAVRAAKIERDAARADVERLKAELAARPKASVEAVKAKGDSIEPEDVRHFVESEKAWLGLVEEQRDAARCALADAQAEAERLRGELAAAIKARDDANAATVKLNEERNAAVTRRDEQDKLKALVDELKAACDQWRALAWDQSEVTDAARAESDELRGELAEARAEAERFRAELAARPAAAGWLTDRERHVLSSMLSERPGDWSLRTLRNWADDILPAFRSILARAGSPPVVEVPAMVFGSGSYEMQKRYRAALDAAGIPWKEVPRE